VGQSGAADPYASLYLMPFAFCKDRSRWSSAGHDWTAIPVPGPGSGPLSEDYNVIERVAPNPVAADLDGDGRKAAASVSPASPWWPISMPTGKPR
jgi:hypothetical protein